MPQKGNRNPAYTHGHTTGGFSPETVSVGHGGTLEEGLIELAIKQLLELEEKQRDHA